MAGNQNSETFTVTVAGEPVAEVRLVARDSEGNEITTLSVGQEFVLELVGADLRSGFFRDGVFAIYSDILFDSSIVRPTNNTIERVGNFNLSPKGTFTDGLIDELGAASTLTVASNEEESVIARVTMEAIAAGTVNIISDEADESDSEVLLYGEDDQIPAESVSFTSLTLSVGLSFTLNDDAFTVDEDSGSAVIDVLANDTTTGNSALQIVSFGQPTSGGTVTVDSGVLSFTPAADFNGTAEFTYVAGDNSGVQDTATVTVTVSPINDPPTGVADSFTVIEGTSTRLDVLANDSIDPDTGETLSVSGALSGSGATVTVTSDGLAVDYTPASGFTGTDTFTYTVSDGTASATVTATVTVNTANDPPTAVADSFQINEDASEAEYDVLSNDTRDADNEAFVLDSVGTPSNGGSARISSDGIDVLLHPCRRFLRNRNCQLYHPRHGRRFGNRYGHVYDRRSQ